MGGTYRDVTQVKSLIFNLEPNFQACWTQFYLELNIGLGGQCLGKTRAIIFDISHFVSGLYCPELGFKLFGSAISMCSFCKYCNKIKRYVMIKYFLFYLFFNFVPVSIWLSLKSVLTGPQTLNNYKHLSSQQEYSRSLVWYAIKQQRISCKILCGILIFFCLFMFWVVNWINTTVAWFKILLYLWTWSMI